MRLLLKQCLTMLYERQPDCKFTFAGVNTVNVASGVPVSEVSRYCSGAIACSTTTVLVKDSEVVEVECSTTYFFALSPPEVIIKL